LGRVREDQPVPVVGLDRPTIDRDLKSIVRNEYVIIDGAPQAHVMGFWDVKLARDPRQLPPPAVPPVPHCPQHANVSSHLEKVFAKDGNNRSDTLTELSATMVA